ncbi:hypothetical protein HYW67_01430 [Candidatus Parcubacteria bacterium]|nr:hypothetical protein [Candidatus Parcubacteria bacterium]
MEERSRVVILEVSRHGHIVPLSGIHATLRWTDGDTRVATLEIPVTFGFLNVGGHAERFGNALVLVTEQDEARLDVSVKTEELPRHLAILAEAQSAR